jgi:hypothetical protein
MRSRQQVTVGGLGKEIIKIPGFYHTLIFFKGWDGGGY